MSSVKGISFHSRLTPPGPSGSSFQKPSASSSRRNGCVATSTHKPFRERIIHLLALKAYRKPELLLWMEGEGAGVRDKAELGAILEEVGGVAASGWVGATVDESCRQEPAGPLSPSPQPHCWSDQLWSDQFLSSHYNFLLVTPPSFNNCSCTNQYQHGA